MGDPEFIDGREDRLPGPDPPPDPPVPPVPPPGAPTGTEARDDIGGSPPTMDMWPPPEEEDPCWWCSLRSRSSSCWLLLMS